MKVDADKVGPTLRQRLLDGMSEGQLALPENARHRRGRRPAAVQADRGRDREGRATGTVNLDMRTFAFDSEWRVERKRANDRIDEKAALPAAIVHIAARSPRCQHSKRASTPTR